jgi:shikimate dehydrogenase
MKKLHETYPDYGFEKHVGYGTKAHFEAIKQHGACPLHRTLIHLPHERPIMMNVKAYGAHAGQAPLQPLDITRRTPVYGVVGWPVGHSQSPQLHNQALAAQGLAGVYLPLAVKNLDAFIRRMVRPESSEMDWDLRGFSVTAPHKQAIMSHLDEIDATAQAIGAVNTVALREGKLFGYNTDAEGFLAPLREAYGKLGGARCAVLGAGGAARCAVWALQREGAQVTVLARDTTKAARLAQDFGAASGALVDAALHRYDIVINATPLGTQGPLQGTTPATAAQLHGVALAYDLVYNPARTLFLQEAEAAACATLGGAEMLKHQAAAQFKLWMDKG